MAWRFDVLDSFSVRNIFLPNVRPRTNQILLPLLLVAEEMKSRQASDMYKAALLKFATTYETQALEERKETPEAQVLQAYFDLSIGHTPTCKEVCERAIRAGNDNGSKLGEWLTAKRAGKILREVGCEMKHTNRGSEAVLPLNRRQSLIRRYGIVTSESPARSSDGDGDDGGVNM